MTAKRIIALLLASALAFVPALPCAQAFHYEDAVHYDTAFEDMSVTGIDRDGVDAFCARFAADPVGQYDALLELFDDLETQVALFGIQSDCNAGDEACSAAYEQVQNDYAYAVDCLYAAIAEALTGTQGDALRALMPEDEADSYADYDSADAGELTFTARENALVQQYYLLPEDDDFPDAAAQIYLQLAALRREQAERKGFDSYADYAYAFSFAREYVPEDAQRIHRIVKSYLAPLYVRCELALAYCALPWDDEDVPDGAEALAEIAAHLPDVSPELSEAMEFLLRNRLYRIGSGDELQDRGYVLSLPAYRSLFLFNKVGTRFDAYESTVHEFGHFNADYHNATPALYQYDDIDISEMQSQGLEVLFLPCLQDILVPDGGDEERSLVALRVLSEMLSSVVQGCLYDEFEQTVYADPTLTVDDLHQLEADLNAEYGLDELYEPDAFWIYIPHLFEQPLYYISYAASALPVLDLYLRSLEDYDAAVETYLNLSAADGSDWFLDVTSENGLCDVTDRSDVARLASALEERLDTLIIHLPADSLFGVNGLVGIPDLGGTSRDAGDADILYGVIAALAVLNLVLLVAVTVLCVKLARREKERAAGDCDPWEIP